MGTCTMEDMIITDIENLQELNLQEMPSDHSPEARETRRRHRGPSNDREALQRVRSSAATSASSCMNQATSRHGRRTSSSCSRDQSASSRRPSGEVSHHESCPIFHCTLSIHLYLSNNKKKERKGTQSHK